MPAGLMQANRMFNLFKFVPSKYCIEMKEKNNLGPFYNWNMSLLNFNVTCIVCYINVKFICCIFGNVSSH